MASAACVGCTQAPPSPPHSSMSSKSAVAGPTSASLASAIPTASTSPPASSIPSSPAVAAPSPLTLVAEVPANLATKLFALSGGIALFESGEHGWRLRAAHGAGPLGEIDAIEHLADLRGPREALFAGEAGGELWVSLLNEEGFPQLGYLTLRVAGTSVKRVPDKWYRAVATLDGGQVVALPSRTNPAQLGEDTAQAFEGSSAARARVASIPPDLRLYDVDILPNGEVHALGMNTTDAGVSLFAWIAPPAAPTRRLAIPASLGGAQPTLVHGAPSFLAYVDEKGTWLTEQEGPLVLADDGAEITAACAARDGRLWFAEKPPGGRGRLLRGTIDRRRTPPVEATPVPLPSETELAAASAKECRALDWIDAIVVTTDEVWLTAWCRGGSHALLRASARP